MPFNKKHIPWNKGKKNPPQCGFQKGHKFFKGGEKGWFKKGHKSLSGKNAPNWVGDNISYRGVHSWIQKTLGKPLICSKCGTRKSKIYDWSNISGKYLRTINDWQRLCRKCHIHYDRKTRKTA